MTAPARRRSTRTPAVSVSRRLVGAFTAYVLLLLLVAGAGVATAATVSATRSTELRHEHLTSANTGMMLALTSVESSVRGYRLTGDEAFLAPYDAGLAAFPRQVARALAATGAPDERRLALAQEAIGQEWVRRLAAPVDARVGRSAPTPAEAEAFRDVSTRFRAANTRLEVLSRSRAAAADTAATRAETIVLVLSAAALVLALGIAVVVQRRLHRSLVTPLGAVVTTLGRLTAGHHEARADADMGPREVQTVATSLNLLAEEADRLRAQRAATAHHREIAADISSALRDELLHGNPVTIALQRLGEVLGVDRVYVRLFDEHARGHDSHQWQRTPWASLHESRSDDVFDRVTAERTRSVLRSQGTWVSEDTATDAREDEYTAAFVRQTGARAALVAVMGPGGSALGLLTAMTMGAPRAWTQDEQELVASVAADLARALVVSWALEQQEMLVEQLRELDRTKTDFLSTVSHELRTPLTSIAGYLEMVREGDGGEVPPAVDAMLVVVERNAARLRVLIEDLLTLSRIESGTYRVTHEEVCLAEIAAMVVQSMRPAAGKGSVAVALEVEHPEAMVLGDPGQLERAVTNLVSNAVKFTPEGGWVRIRSGVAEGRVVLEVADSGIGIPAEDQGQLFSRFFRASNASEMAIPGTGLGLAIVRSIVELHAGELRLTSVAGEGTTVTVDLPLLERSPSAADSAAASASVDALAHHELVASAPAAVSTR